SNDYLGLANDPHLRDAATAAISEFGVGAGASRLVSGTLSPHVRLEAALAKWKGTQAALAFSSGYAAAVGTLQAIASKNDVVLLDKLSHASLIDGAKLSGATIRVFPHNHLGKLESHLEWAQRERPDARVVIVTEAVFSMDGDRAPLRQLVGLKKRFGAMLLLDEAHSIGVIGPNGRGLSAAEGLTRHVDIQMGTLSKALGVSGGYICASRSVIEWLINRARSFIFTTAPPPAMAAAATAAVEFLGSHAGEECRLLLWARIAALRSGLEGGVLGETEAMHSGSAIYPMIVGDEREAVELSRALYAEGLLVPAIRYPTVARGAARLRVTVTAAHSEQQITQLAQVLNRLRPEAIPAA
ncbi:MAG: aminotransferase class I/II-fold pyridoxal phosphate-dependent enzyme, partial [Chthoniobacterales bacterium]|nr:aminotransferase class I/II-fold pyridoxal phosphate-dependent enzyme [Chthoniobacterales bacterium]